VFEILTFRLAPGVDASSFRAIDARVQIEFAYQQPGFVRRTLGRHDDGRWLILTIWTDVESALAAQQRFDDTELGKEFVAVLTDVVVERFRGMD
jgi:hypothetical protein